MESMVRALREIGFGFLFFLSAMLGAFGIGPALFIGPSKSYDESMWQTIRALVIGSIIGGATWLWIRYNFLTKKTPPSPA